MTDSKENKLTGWERQRHRVLKYPWYAPADGWNGYRQKVIRKISYCEDFVYFLNNIADYNNLLNDSFSFSDAVSTVQFMTPAHNCSMASDGCTNVVMIAYDTTEFSKRKIEIMIEILGRLMAKSLTNIIAEYYQDEYSCSNVIALCEGHLDELDINPNLRGVIRWSIEEGRWYISTAKSPESLLT